jgi:hypothetical protein
MRTTTTTAALFFALSCLTLIAGCSFNARDAETYRKVTRDLLETRSADIKGCYDAELKRDPKVGGTVVVRFTVQKGSGQITAAEVDAASTAPASLGQCVVGAISGLVLDPPDARDGNATFRWEFQVKS